MKYKILIGLMISIILISGCVEQTIDDDTRDSDNDSNISGQPGDFDMKPSLDYVCYNFESDNVKKNWCFAILYSDESYCDKVTECVYSWCDDSWDESTYYPYKARCYRDVAHLKNDKSLCNDIADFGLESYDEHLIDECRELVAFDGEDEVTYNYIPSEVTDISTCIDLEDDVEAEECITKAAIQNEDGSLCGTDLTNFEGQDETNLRYLCYEKYSEASHNLNSCTKTGVVDYGHTSMGLKSICTAQTTEYLPENVNLDNIDTLCADTTGMILARLWDNLCHTHYAKIKDDIEYCKGKWSCLYEVGTINDCSLAGNEDFKCYWDYAFKENDPSICLKMSSEETKRTCISRFAYQNKDQTLCDDLDFKDTCYLAAMRGVSGFKKFLLDS